MAGSVVGHDDSNRNYTFIYCYHSDPVLRTGIGRYRIHTGSVVYVVYLVYRDGPRALPRPVVTSLPTHTPKEVSYAYPCVRQNEVERLVVDGSVSLSTTKMIRER